MRNNEYLVFISHIVFEFHITYLISRPSHSTIYATMVLVPCRKLESDVCEPLHENQAALPITHRLLCMVSIFYCAVVILLLCRTRTIKMLNLGFRW